MTTGFTKEEVKKQANVAIDERRDKIIAIAQDILGNPETGYRDWVYGGTVEVQGVLATC